METLKRIRRTAAAGLVAILAASSAHAADRSAYPRFRVLMSNRAGIMVRLALEEAVNRLASETCRRIFDDFADSQGHSLADNLRATGHSAAEALSGLYFVEGDAMQQCRNLGNTALFTAPGNHVVYVCGSRFVKLSGINRRGEMLLIHELLHTLGLGENPPTSTQITDTVVQRCS
jgi:hypothetical protein